MRTHSLREWIRTLQPGFGYTRAREYAHRAFDPLPVMRLPGSRRLLVDVEAAERWLQREAKRGAVDLGNLVDEVTQLAADLRAGARR